MNTIWCLVVGLDKWGKIIMKKSKLTRVIASLLMTASVLALNPIGARAEWREDIKDNYIAWWYSEGDSYATGWREIDGKWYYFDTDGYMVKDKVIDGYYIDKNGNWYQNINEATERYIAFREGIFKYYFLDLVTGEEYGHDPSFRYPSSDDFTSDILFLYEKMASGELEPNASDKNSGINNISDFMRGLKPDDDEAMLKLQLFLLDKFKGEKNAYGKFITPSNQFLSNIIGRPLERNTFNESLSLKERALLLKKVYEFSNSNKVLGEQLLNYLKVSNSHDIISTTVNAPIAGVSMAGEQFSDGSYRYGIDSSIVFAKHPFIMVTYYNKSIRTTAVATDVKDMELSDEHAANIAKMFYTYVQNKN